MGDSDQKKSHFILTFFKYKARPTSCHCAVSIQGRGRERRRGDGERSREREIERERKKEIYSFHGFDIYHDANHRTATQIS